MTESHLPSRPIEYARVNTHGQTVVSQFEIWGYDAGMTVRLWVIQAIAMASEGCEYPVGEKHALLVFTAAPNLDGALDQMQRGIAAQGWGVTEVVRSGEISSDPDAIQDAILRTAARNAVECGCGIVAYADPIPTGSE